MKCLIRCVYAADKSRNISRMIERHRRLWWCWSVAKISLLGAVVWFTGTAVAQESGGAAVSALLGPRREATVFRAELAEAWHAYGRSNLEAAEPLFRRVTEARGSPPGELCEALFGLGWCRAFRRPLPDTQGAMKIFS